MVPKASEVLEYLRANDRPSILSPRLMIAVYKHRAGTLYDVCRDVDPLAFDERRTGTKLLYKVHAI